MLRATVSKAQKEKPRRGSSRTSVGMHASPASGSKKRPADVVILDERDGEGDGGVAVVGTLPAAGAGDRGLVDQLESLGIPHAQALAALRHVGGKDLAAAVEWVFSHGDEVQDSGDDEIVVMTPDTVAAGTTETPSTKRKISKAAHRGSQTRAAATTADDEVLVVEEEVSIEMLSDDSDDRKVASCSTDNKDALVRELVEAWGFGRAEAMEAVKHGTSVEDAVGWILDHETPKPAADKSPATPRKPQTRTSNAGAELTGDMKEVYRRLRGMGFAEDEARRMAVNAKGMADSVEEMVMWAVGGGRSEKEIYDVVTLETVPISQTYLVECGKSHRFKYETLYEAVRAHITEGRLPSCPLSNGPPKDNACSYVLSVLEIEQVLNLRFQGREEPPQEDRRCLGLRFGRRDNGSWGWLSDKACKLTLRVRELQAGAIECPFPGCEYMFAPSRSGHGRREECKCPVCGTSFCSVCRRRPYHFHCTCNEVVTLSKLWLEWRTTGHRQYLQRMASEDQHYAQAFKDFDSKRAEHDKVVQEAQAAWRLLQADETYKGTRCRLCPHCGKVIEKLTGCDSMVCGADAHGGNMQAGCGKCFSWGSARPYVADKGQAPSVPSFTEAAPEKAFRHHHMLMQDTPVLCDLCREEVVGPLAECVHCASHIRCIKCMMSDKKEGTGQHDDTHVFMVKMGDALIAIGDEM